MGGTLSVRLRQMKNHKSANSIESDERIIARFDSSNMYTRRFVFSKCFSLFFFVFVGSQSINLSIIMNLMTFFLHNLFFLVAAEYIIQCHRSDPKLLDCLKGSLHHLKPYLARGIPEIEVCWSLLAFFTLLLTHLIYRGFFLVDRCRFINLCLHCWSRFFFQTKAKTIFNCYNCYVALRALNDRFEWMIIKLHGDFI